MNIVTKQFEYQSVDVSCRGIIAYDDTVMTKRPLVLVAHDWSGCNHFAEANAKKIASLGYVGFAIDMYGNGRIGKSNEEKMTLMQPLMQNRHLLLSRINAAYEAALLLPFVDTSKVGAIGFCFGGLCVLDFARSGIAINGIVSFHGLLTPPSNAVLETIRAKILVLHGYQDPMATPDTVLAFADEMTQSKADWQIQLYGNTMHAFMNPEAHDASFGTVYNSTTEKRAWQSMISFFNDVF